MNNFARYWKLMVIVLTIAIPAHAALSDALLLKEINYNQTSGAAPTAAASFTGFLAIDFQNPGDFNTASVTYPGPSSPQALGATPGQPTRLSFGTNFASQALMDAAYPMGTYTYSATGATNQTASLTYSVDAYTATVPAVTPATFAALPGMIPGTPLTLNFNAFQANAAAGLAQTFVLFNSPTDSTAPAFGPFANTTTSFTIPANSLKPNTTYTLTLRFRGRNNGTSGTVGTFVASDVQTKITFTTGGGLSQVFLEKDIVYLQTSAAAPTAPAVYEALLDASFQNPADFDSATVTYPGPNSPQALNGPDMGDLFFPSPIFASPAALNTAYPFGSYQFNAKNSTTSASQSATISYQADAYTSAIPAFTAATFAALQGMNPTASFTLNFNSFPVNAAATFGVTQLDFDSAMNPTVTFKNLPNTSTFLTLPANTLLPNTAYTVTLSFSDRTDVAVGSVNTRIKSGALTLVAFTTGGGAVSGTLTEVDLLKNVFYAQTSGISPTTPTGYAAGLRAQFQNVGDFDGGTVTYDIPFSPQTQTLSKRTTLQLGFDSPTFASQAAMDAAFPFTGYFFQATNSTKQTSQSTTLLYGLDAYPAAIPAVSGATFTALQGMNATAALTLSFNAFTANSSAASSQTVLQFASPSDPQSPHQFTTSNTSTSFLLPANTLLAGTAYTLTLNFAGMNSITAGTVNTVVSSGIATQVAFTTGVVSGAPVITSTGPSNVNSGGTGFTLTVNGSAFTSGAVVQWNTTPLTTTFVSATQLTAQVPASLLLVAGAETIKVIQGTLTSNSVSLPVTPVITSLSPAVVAAGSGGFLLIVNGAGLTLNSIVTVNGTPLPIDAGTFSESGQFGVGVPGSVIANTGNLPVTVTEGGITSAPVTLQVISLGITSLSPTSAPVGSAPFTLTVNGFGFLAGDLVAIDRAGGFLSALQTTFVNSTQLTAQVTASLNTALLSAGTDQITVRRPPGAGTTTSSLPFAIVAPLTITSSSIPGGILNAPYLGATLQETNGTPPYLVVASGLPAGLIVSSGGTLSGTPTVSGTFPVNFTVTDSSTTSLMASKTLTLTISAITVSFSADRTAVLVSAAPANPSALGATVALNFLPDPAAKGWTGGPDPAGGCATTKLTCIVNIASSAASGSAPFSAGTVAGTWSATVTSVAGGLPSPAPAAATLAIPLAAPVIATTASGLGSGTSVQIVNASSTGFTIVLSGSVTSRDITSAHFVFNAAQGAQLTGGDVTVPFNGADQTQWFNTSASQATGGTFSLSVPFSYSGDPAALGTVTATLTSSAGVSAPVTGGK